MNTPALLLPQQTLQKRQSKKPAEVVISKRAQEILEAIHTYRFVTAWDIARLFYSPTSINHVRELLSLLSGKKDYQDRTYLYRFPLPNTRIGNTEKSIRLAVEAVRICKVVAWTLIGISGRINSSSQTMYTGPRNLDTGRG